MFPTPSSDDAPDAGATSSADAVSRSGASPVLRRQLTVPDVDRHAIARPRALRELDRSARRPATLLVAPAGTGKTTLAAQWAVEQAARVAWLSLSPAQDTPDRFWGAIAAALAGAVPGMEDLDAAPGSPTFVLEVLERLERSAEPVVLVVDDLHAVDLAPLADELVSFIRFVPDHVRLLLLSRDLPALDLAGLRADRRVDIAPAELLVVGPDEAEDVLRGCFGLHPSPAQLAAVLQRTAGWAAGLSLAGIAARDSQWRERDLPFFDGGHPLARDYVSSRVLHPLPDDLRDVAVRTSVFDRFTSDLAAEALDLDVGLVRAAVSDLRRRQLLLPASRDDGRWVRWNPLVAGALRALLGETAATAADEVRRRGGRWLQRHDHAEDAIPLLLRAGDAAVAAELLEHQLVRTLGRGRFDAVSSWLRSMPDEQLAARPALARRGVAAAIFLGHPDQVRRWRAACASPASSTPVLDALAACDAALGAGDVQVALAAGDRLDPLAEDADPFELAVARLVQARALLWSLRLDDAVAAAREARVVAERAKLVSVAAAATARLALIEAWRANRAGALLHTSDCRSALMAIDADATPPAFVDLQVAHSVLAHAEHRFDEARSALTAIARRNDVEHDPLLVGFVFLLLARVEARARHEAPALEELIRHAEHVLRDVADAGPLILDLRLKVHVGKHRIGRHHEHLRQLSTKELLVLQLLRSDMTLGQIAGELFLSVNTVKTHCRVIYRKLGVAGRREAVELAFASATATAAAPGPVGGGARRSTAGPGLRSAS